MANQFCAVHWQSKQRGMNCVKAFIIRWVHYASRYRSQFQRSAPCFRSGAFTTSKGFEDRLYHIRHNLAYLVYQPLGQFKKAEELLRQNDLFVANKAGWLSIHLLACWLYESMGDWARLASALKTIFALEEQSEELDEEEDNGPLLLHLYQLIGQGKFVLATEIMDKLDHAPSQNSDLLMNVEICRVWLARRTGRFQDALDAADKALAQPWDLPWNRGIIAVEREIARFQDGAQPLEFGSEIKRLIELRARPWLMRLRALLALRCHRTGNPRWRDPSSVSIAHQSALWLWQYFDHTRA